MFYLYSLYAILFFVFILAIVIISWEVSTIVGVIRAKGVPFVPLTKKQIKFLDESVKLNSDDQVVDLGCGEGRVLRLFEKQGVKNLSGFEVNYYAYLSAKIKNHFAKSKVNIYFKNFFKEDFAKYNIVFCYLLPKCLLSLRDKFDKELKSGTKIISYNFQVKDWKEPVEVIKSEDGKQNIYVYRI